MADESEIKYCYGHIDKDYADFMLSKNPIMALKRELVTVTEGILEVIPQNLAKDEHVIFYHQFPYPFESAKGKNYELYDTVIITSDCNIIYFKASVNMKTGHCILKYTNYKENVKLPKGFSELTEYIIEMTQSQSFLNDIQVFLKQYTFGVIHANAQLLTLMDKNKKLKRKEIEFNLNIDSIVEKTLSESRIALNRDIAELKEKEANFAEKVAEQEEKEKAYSDTLRRLEKLEKKVDKYKSLPLSYKEILSIQSRLKEAVSILDGDPKSAVALIKEVLQLDECID